MPAEIVPPPAIRCIGVANFLGAPGAGPELGPEALRAAGIVAAIRRTGLAVGWQATLEPPAGERIAALHRLLLDVADAAAGVVAAGDKPLCLGGDHAQAAGVWRGVGRALGRAPGLVWLDAHLDAHTPATTPSGNPHGMPLAALLGEGAPALTDIPGPTLDPRRVALIGARSYEPAEAALLERLGVRVFSAREIAGRGLPAVFAEALHIATAGGFPYGISLDLDVIDPRQVAAVSTPAAGGLPADAVGRALRGCLRQRRCAGLEIVEYFPAQDPDGRTARLVLELAAAAAGPGAGHAGRQQFRRLAQAAC